MTININLSSEDIQSAIRKLNKAKDNLEIGLQQAIDVLAKDGAFEAQAAFGRMATASPQTMGTNEAQIVVSGKAPIIAEFGAGYATMEYHPFAKNAPVPIKVGSYSESKFPRGMFYSSDYIDPGEGYWFFGGREYDRVEPRLGLLQASRLIEQTAVEKAKEVIKL